MSKYIIFDSGALINIVQNGLEEIFKKLATEFQGEFLITPTVKYETIEHPIKIKRFEWGAIRIQQLLDDETIKLVEEEEIISMQELKEKTNSILDSANTCFLSKGKPIHLIERGEAECLALSLMLSEKNIDSVIAIDERTARMLCEDSKKLKELMESKLETRLELNDKRIRELQKIKIIRSAELMFMANEKRLFEEGKKTLEAVLYAIKYGGCSISEKEVELMKKL